jgi:uncharacterized protein YkwD
VGIVTSLDASASTRPEETIVRIAHRPRLSILVSALALGALSLAASLVWAVPSVSAASGPADPEASEYVRLINGVRAANGLGPLRLDPVLAGLARDTSMSCPSDPSLVMLGRARDGAENNYVSHSLRLCPDVKFVSILQTTYNYGSVGEIMLQNGGYGTGQFLVDYSGRTSTYESYSYSTTGHGILGWMSSGSHAAIIVGGYDRIGCGGWTSADGTYYYDCLLSQGGPNGTNSPPTQSPFPDLVPPPPPPPDPTPAPTVAPTPAPTPAPIRPAPRAASPTTPIVDQPAASPSTELATPEATESATPTATTEASLGPEPTESPASMVAGISGRGGAGGPTALGGAAAAQLSDGSGSSADHASGISAERARNVAIVAGLAASVLCAAYALVLLRRRRRSGAPAS